MIYGGTFDLINNRDQFAKIIDYDNYKQNLILIPFDFRYKYRPTFSQFESKFCRVNSSECVFSVSELNRLIFTYIPDYYIQKAPKGLEHLQLQAGIPFPDKFYTQATYHIYMNLRKAFVIDGDISHNSPPKNLPVLYKNKKYFLSSDILQYLIGSIHNGMNIHSLEIPLSTWSEYFVNHHYLKVDTDMVEKILWYLNKRLSSEKLNSIFESLLLGE